MLPPKFEYDLQSGNVKKNEAPKLSHEKVTSKVYSVDNIVII
jgi:hypothetical protein